MSQCDRILVVLGDGREHSFHQILRVVPCVVHSRIAELRSRGHLIECRRDGDDYLYRLRSASSAPGPFLTPTSEPDHGPGAEQLTLAWVA